MSLLDDLHASKRRRVERAGVMQEQAQDEGQEQEQGGNAAAVSSSSIRNTGDFNGPFLARRHQRELPKKVVDNVFLVLNAFIPAVSFTPAFTVSDIAKGKTTPSASSAKRDPPPVEVSGLTTWVLASTGPLPPSLVPRILAQSQAYLERLASSDHHLIQLGPHALLPHQHQHLTYTNKGTLDRLLEATLIPSVQQCLEAATSLDKEQAWDMTPEKYRLIGGKDSSKADLSVTPHDDWSTGWWAMTRSATREQFEAIHRMMQKKDSFPWLHSVLGSKKRRLERLGYYDEAARLTLNVTNGEHHFVIASWTSSSYGDNPMTLHHLAVSQLYAHGTKPTYREFGFAFALATYAGNPLDLDASLFTDLYEPPPMIYPPENGRDTGRTPSSSGAGGDRPVDDDQARSNDPAKPGKDSGGGEGGGSRAGSGGGHGGGDGGGGTVPRSGAADGIRGTRGVSTLAKEDDGKANVDQPAHHQTPPLATSAAFSPYPTPPEYTILAGSVHDVFTLTTHFSSSGGVSVYGDASGRFAVKFGFTLGRGFEGGEGAGVEVEEDSREGEEDEEDEVSTDGEEEEERYAKLREFATEVEVYKALSQLNGIERCIVPWIGTYRAEEGVTFLFLLRCEVITSLKDVDSSAALSLLDLFHCTTGHIHGDVSARNIGRINGQLRLFDLGRARKADEEERRRERQRFEQVLSGSREEFDMYLDWEEE
ncbi:hypothetical protein JCM11251_005493 [Rhodosporidiobolus azoricus]